MPHVPKSKNPITMKTNDALYPIREVSNLTGVNSITLRAWERRYGLIEPVRTDGGHRLYTLEHIQQIKAAVKLTEEGIPISQVKTRLMQAVPQVKEEIHQGDYDYLSKIVDATLEFDLDSLSIELDQLFQDVSDKALCATLKNASQLLAVHASETIDTFWESQLLPRLYTRLRFSTRHVSLHTNKKLWLQSEDKNGSIVMLVLAAIRLADQGFYSVISSNAQKNDEALFQNIKATHCHGLVVVDESQKLDKTHWKAWVMAHPSLEFHFFTERAETFDMGNVLQCHGHNF